MSTPVLLFAPVSARFPPPPLGVGAAGGALWEAEADGVGDPEEPPSPGGVDVTSEADGDGEVEEGGVWVSPVGGT
ncbi:hypothetical protein, partial [Streptomyces niveiscabiei]|uniref:hypothetical protein n=1 Tax=Streptomyces niveiscabiei TaxID=164115 RepID=UPI000AA21331